MSPSVRRPTAIRAGLAAVVAVLAATGTAVGVSAASASPTPHLAATTTIDHQLCYNSTLAGILKPLAVAL